MIYKNKKTHSYGFGRSFDFWIALKIIATKKKVKINMLFVFLGVVGSNFNVNLFFFFDCEIQVLNSQWYSNKTCS